ncbi:hypothetical protein [Enterococcus faecalis]|uniref:hypothetical protein n=1 Tax=Enterococcus faecalis TaxID=1351 RepID=UPI003DA08E75
MSDLIMRTNLPNIGVVLEKKLLLAGIENQAIHLKAKKIGSKEAFFRIHGIAK